MDGPEAGRDEIEGFVSSLLVLAGIVGLAVGTWYLYQVRFAGMTPWIGLDHLRFPAHFRRLGQGLVEFHFLVREFSEAPSPVFRRRGLPFSRGWIYGVIAMKTSRRIALTVAALTVTVWILPSRSCA